MPRDLKDKFSLLPDVPGDMYFQAKPYGPDYRTNKLRVTRALDSQGITGEFRALLLAVAMLETNSFLAKDRDW